MVKPSDPYNSIMNKNISNKHTRNIFLLLLFVFIINLLQAYFTGIHDDEAYYWVYANHMSWGYFDHPPMVALGIYIFSWIPGELGVRMSTIIFNLLTIWLIWKIVTKYFEPNSIMFSFIVLSLPMIHSFGFVATPDPPLLFFVGLYILVFLNYIDKNSVKNTLLLGLVAALMLYSKYHGVLVIFFMLLANLKLLKRPSLYLAGITGVILFLPHLYWQYQHNFPSLSYHLVERNTEFKISYIFEYILNIFLTFNPVLFIIVILAILKADFKSTIDRSMFSLFVGIILFFFISTLKGQVQPQWAYVATIPAIYFLYKISNQDKIQKAIKWTFYISIFLLMAARIVLTLDTSLFNTNFHNNEEALQIKELTKDYPVIFSGSFQRVSNFAFYNQTTNVHLFGRYRKTQFDIWNNDKKFYNKPIYYVSKQPIKGSTKHQMTKEGDLYFLFIKNYTEEIKKKLISQLGN